MIWFNFIQNAAVYEVFQNDETVDYRQTCPNRFQNCKSLLEIVFFAHLISIRRYQS